VVGKTLGHYEIIEPLGAGGMGEVYRERDTKLDREIALMVIEAAHETLRRESPGPGRFSARGSH
jgi:serine/threonine protein kinase